ncbi:zinc finger and SCAN domain-containing protein 29-like [Chelonia mydas]|uniref:zinc finger and SCAN domain-containing protein 29-like n=1 Tax=Chelonia mydas TaxID=8469 RepID=UPI001CA969EA|nr:zinc finger and SCAN domain-containing protein 29-like [Chelonia mydas]
MPVLATLVITLNFTALPSGDQLSDPPFKFSGNFESPLPVCSARHGVLAASVQMTLPPPARRSPVWSNGEVLDLISVWREEAVQSQLRASRRNYDTYGQILRALIERGHDWDTLQCRVKVKELRNTYHKAQEANSHSGAAPVTCRFYKELDKILGANPSSTLKNAWDTSEAVAAQSAKRQEEESGSEGAEKERNPEPEDGPASIDACSQELFSSQEEDATLRSQPSLLSMAEILQRLRKRPQRSKEDLLHEVMQLSLTENQKLQK